MIAPPKTEIQGNIFEAIREITGEGKEISLESTLEDLGFDSQDKMDLLMKIEKKCGCGELDYGKVYSPSNSQTIKDLVDYVHKIL